MGLLLALCFPYSMVARTASSIIAAPPSGVPGQVVQRQLTAAIDNGHRNFTFPPVVVWGVGEGGLEAAGASNMRLVGSAGGTQLWFAPGGGFRLLRCANVTVEGITIDYAPLRKSDSPRTHNIHASDIDRM